MDEASQTNPGDVKHAPNFFAFVIGAFAAILIYILSSGPAFRLAEIKRSPHASLIEKIYGPMAWVYYATPLQKPVGVYYHLWLPEYFDAHGDETARVATPKAPASPSSK